MKKITKILFFLPFAFTLIGCSGEPTKTIETFDWSKYNGRVYYPYYLTDNEVRIANVKFPYTYKIPDYADGHRFASFYAFIIRDSKIYEQCVSTDIDHQNKLVTYDLVEEEMDYKVINNRFFTTTGEIVFDDDVLFCGGGFAITKEKALSIGAPIFTIETQHNSWVAASIENNHNSITNVIKTLSSSNPTIELPHKEVINNENPRIEVDLEYIGVDNPDSYVLNGYNLTLLSEEPSYFRLVVKAKYKDGYSICTLHF